MPVSGLNFFEPKGQGKTMEMTKFDVTLTVSLLIGILLMSWLFPVLGLTGTQPSDDDVPEFEVNSSRFDFTGDFPQRPGDPGSNPINWDENGGKYDNTLWLEGDTGNGVQLFVVNDNNVSDPEIKYDLAEWSSGAVVQRDNFTVTDDEDSRGRLKLDTDADSDPEWDVQVDNIRFTDENTSDFEALALFTTDRRPDKTDFWDPLPNVSGATVWIGQVLAWLFLSTWEIILNALGLVLDIGTFLIGVLVFISTNYVDVVTADALHPFASLVLVTPLVLMYLLWLKFVLLLVDLIWIG